MGGMEMSEFDQVRQAQSFPAKWRSRCSICGHLMEVGDPIVHTGDDCDTLTWRGTGRKLYSHLDCAMEDRRRR